MKTAVVNFKTTPEIKKQAQKYAQEHGISLSALLNQYMAHIHARRQSQAKLSKQLTKDAQELAKIDSDAVKAEEPSDWLKNEIKESEKEEKEGWTSPAFDNIEDSIAWLDDPNAKYENQIQQKV
jgi:antitoxin component of RelBE/YafQ-DinJ toxin-antitoxin module